MELSVLRDYAKVAAARWFLSLAAGAVSSELDELGISISDARKGLGLGNVNRKGWLRAEWSLPSLR